MQGRDEEGRPWKEGGSAHSPPLSALHLAEAMVARAFPPSLDLYARHKAIHIDVAIELELASKFWGQDGVQRWWEVAQSILQRQLKEKLIADRHREDTKSACSTSYLPLLRGEVGRPHGCMREAGVPLTRWWERVHGQTRTEFSEEGHCWL